MRVVVRATRAIYERREIRGKNLETTMSEFAKSHRKRKAQAEDDPSSPPTKEAFEPAETVSSITSTHSKHESRDLKMSEPEKILKDESAVERARQLALHHVDAQASAAYYAQRAVWFTRANFLIELLLAIGTASSIAAWKIWATEFGEGVWSMVLGIVAVANVIKPMLNLGDRIRVNESRAGRWHQVAVQLQRIALNARIADGFPPQVHKTLEEVLARYDELSQEDSPAAANWYFQRVRHKIKERFPPKFHWPWYERRSYESFKTDDVPESVDTSK